MKKLFLSVISIILIITTLSACKDDSRIKNEKNAAITVKYIPFPKANLRKEKKPIFLNTISNQASKRFTTHIFGL